MDIHKVQLSNRFPGCNVLIEKRVYFWDQSGKLDFCKPDFTVQNKDGSLIGRWDTKTGAATESTKQKAYKQSGGSLEIKRAPGWKGQIVPKTGMQKGLAW